MSESAGWPQDSPGILGVVGTLLWAEERRNIRDLTTSTFEHLCSDCYLSQLFAEQKSRQYANGLIQVKKVTRTGPPPIRTVCTWPNTLEPSARPIAAIQTCVGDDGIDHLGMIVQLPGDATFAIVGDGFSGATTRIRWQGSSYFVFRDDLVATPR